MKKREQIDEVLQGVAVIVTAIAVIWISAWLS